MRRTQIYLDERTSATLGRVARRSGRTRSQLIREAIEARFGVGADPERVLRALRATAGGWKRRRLTGAEVVHRLRGGHLAKKIRNGT